ncbi:MAG: pentapeptide repeat-containing protein [Alphaproteobacteria bacterium]
MKHIRFFSHGPDFQQRKMDGRDLTKLDLRLADFRGASLNGANFADMDLWGCNFSGADLSYANLSGANLTGVIADNTNFSHANARNSHWKRARISQAKANGCDLSGANLEDSQWSFVDMVSIVLTNAQLDNWKWQVIDNQVIDLSHACLGADFSGSHMVGVQDAKQIKLFLTDFSSHTPIAKIKEVFQKVAKPAEGKIAETIAAVNDVASTVDLVVTDPHIALIKKVVTHPKLLQAVLSVNEIIVKDESAKANMQSFLAMVNRGVGELPQAPIKPVRAWPNFFRRG